MLTINGQLIDKGRVNKFLLLFKVVNMPLALKNFGPLYILYSFALFLKINNQCLCYRNTH
ncbi:hypothetical protein Oweho_2507 [Owenweeksia hongkongensis DSM 17368]|uniref:Uncharacterized protein n=1 Tax=Owenweeksia hongkongensis (strain DSM 17368 / CIP 108786 / JCM 12287 / NRRL B-23963 / UST20020801) TaxID=926562 RepID=G8R7U6_OWEHD|nr:hypothetical protein Oweho_2507 [Owenweeksia hongkongensis DSM 17368]